MPQHALDDAVGSAAMHQHTPGIEVLLVEDGGGPLRPVTLRYSISVGLWSLSREAASGGCRRSAGACARSRRRGNRSTTHRGATAVHRGSVARGVGEICSTATLYRRIPAARIANYQRFRTAPCATAQRRETIDGRLSRARLSTASRISEPWLARIRAIGQMAQKSGATVCKGSNLGVSSARSE
jgi:hypothetical protein